MFTSCTRRTDERKEKYITNECKKYRFVFAVPRLVNSGGPKEEVYFNDYTRLSDHNFGVDIIFVKDRLKTDSDITFQQDSKAPEKKSGKNFDGLSSLNRREHKIRRRDGSEDQLIEGKSIEILP